MLNHELMLHVHPNELMNQGTEPIFGLDGEHDSVTVILSAQASCGHLASQVIEVSTFRPLAKVTCTFRSPAFSVRCGFAGFAVVGSVASLLVIDCYKRRS
ncbi:MAG: hypothetical protein EON54_02025 [Alcaligenaceae bacterium]|nr:MAG: hypothetical protein EON54_02025 [Alcaligenaceae bacterium]